ELVFTYVLLSTYGLFSFLFFFLSRRRHTRSKRDWSSDVCSSDLLLLPTVSSAVVAATPAGSKAPAKPQASSAAPAAPAPVKLEISEERRVGKEGRARWVLEPWIENGRRLVERVGERVREGQIVEY